jgi:hypothetical protein
MGVGSISEVCLHYLFNPSLTSRLEVNPKIQNTQTAPTATQKANNPSLPFTCTSTTQHKN